MNARIPVTLVTASLAAVLFAALGCADDGPRAVPNATALVAPGQPITATVDLGPPPGPVIPVVAPCDGVTCSGYGVCSTTKSDEATCSCSPGFEAAEPLRCIPLTAALCGSRGVCWEHPYPHGLTLNALWEAPDGETWGAGANGFIAKASTGWHPEQIATGALHDMWGAASDDVWIVGVDGALHWDGSGWTGHEAAGPAQTWGTLRAVWGTGPDEVWAGGHGLFRWDGAAWHFVDTTSWDADPEEPAPTPQIVDLHGSGADDLWLVHTRGVMHYDGRLWRDVPVLPVLSVSGGEAPLKPVIRSVWVGAPGEVWLIGTGAYRWNGQRWLWSALGVGNGGALDRIWGRSTGDVWIAGHGADGRRLLFRHDGEGFEDHCGGGRRITALGGDRILWAAGPDGITALTGDAWPERVVASVAKIGGPSAAMVWGVGADSDGRGVVLYRRNQTWDRFRTLDAREPDFRLRDVWGHISGDLWIVGGWSDPWGGEASYGVAERFRAGSWVSMPVPVAAPVTGVWGATPDDVWFVQGDQPATRRTSPRGAILHWGPVTGGHWLDQPPHEVPGALMAIAGAGADAIWTVGIGVDMRCLSLRWNGATWSQLPCPYEGVLTDLWVGGPDSAVAVGDDEVLRWTGAAWRPIGCDGLTGITAVSGDGERLWVVADGIGLAHFDGQAWRRVPIDLGLADARARAPVQLDGLWAANDRTFFAWSDAGVIVRGPGASTTASDDPVICTVDP